MAPALHAVVNAARSASRSLATALAASSSSCRLPTWRLRNVTSSFDASARRWASAADSDSVSPFSTTRAPWSRVCFTLLLGVKDGITMVAGMPSRPA